MSEVVSLHWSSEEWTWLERRAAAVQRRGFDAAQESGQSERVDRTMRRDSAPPKETGARRRPKDVQQQRGDVRRGESARVNILPPTAVQ